MFNNLPLIAAAYQYVRTTMSLSGSTPVKLLASNPRRWSVRFSLAGTSSTLFFVDAGGQQVVSLNPTGIPFNNTLLIKFTDEPGSVGQEWWGSSQAGGSLEITIHESIFVG